MRSSQHKQHALIGSLMLTELTEAHLLRQRLFGGKHYAAWAAVGVVHVPLPQPTCHTG